MRYCDTVYNKNTKKRKIVYNNKKININKIKQISNNNHNIIDSNWKNINKENNIVILDDD